MESGLIQIVKASKPYRPKYGDILYGEQYIARIALEKYENVFPLSFEGDPWSSLHNIGINVNDFKKSVTYECPWSDNKYYWFMPFLISVKNDIKIYKEKGCIPEYYFNKYWTDKIDLNEMNDVQKISFGHGYTIGTLPSDGDNRKIKVEVDLNNGDSIIGSLWVWYNK